MNIYAKTNGVFIDSKAYMTLYYPNYTVYYGGYSLINSIGNHSFNFTAPSVVGIYPVKVDYYYANGTFISTVSDQFSVEYNYTGRFDTQDTWLQQLINWFNTYILGNYDTSTTIYGKLDLYELVTFYSVSNFNPSICNLTVNTVVYPMNISGHIAQYDYLITSSGLYDWEVSCVP